MPICNTTLEYHGDLAERLLNSPLLQFDEVRERGSSKVKRYYTPLKLRDFAFTVYPDTGKVIVKGSWAKFHNNGLHNHTRYSSADLQADIISLSDLFGYDFSEGLLHGVEAGVNLDLTNLPQPYFTPEYLLPLFICYQGRKPFLPMKSIKGAGQGVECSMTHYRLKAYDKGTQYHLPNSLLRLEYDCNQMKELQPFGIRLLRDLTDLDKMTLLGLKIQGMIADVVMMEPVAVNRLSGAERKLYEKAERPSFWHDLTSRNRNYYRVNFIDLMQTYSLHRLHEILCEQARYEWEVLTENCNIFASVQPIITTTEPIENCNIFLPVNCEKHYNVLDEIAAVSFGGQAGQSSANIGAGLVERRCEVTGVLLHEQQPQKSKVVGVTTLTHDSDTLNLFRQRYGRKASKRDYHSEAYRLAHGPRNEKSNPPNNLLRRIRKAEADCDLFGLAETLRLTAEQQALLGYFDGTERAVDPVLKRCVKGTKEKIMDSFKESQNPAAGGIEKKFLLTQGGPVDTPQRRLEHYSQKKRQKKPNQLKDNTINLFPLEPNGC